MEAFSCRVAARGKRYVKFPGKERGHTQRESECHERLARTLRLPDRAADRNAAIVPLARGAFRTCSPSDFERGADHARGEEHSANKGYIERIHLTVEIVDARQQPSSGPAPWGQGRNAGLRRSETILCRHSTYGLKGIDFTS
jgi:hypothetical protein